MNSNILNIKYEKQQKQKFESNSQNSQNSENGILPGEKSGNKNQIFDEYFESNFNEKYENNFHEKSDNKFQIFLETGIGKQKNYEKKGIFPNENISSNESTDYSFSLNPETTEWWKKSNVRDSTHFLNSNESFFNSSNNSNKKNKNNNNSDDNDTFFTKNSVKIVENRPNMTTIKPLFSLISSRSNSLNARKGLL